MEIKRRTIIFILLLVAFVLFFWSRTISAENITPPVTKKVMVINFNPVIESQNNKKLTEFYNWNNPQTLSNQYIIDVKQVSGNYVNYEIAEWHDVDDFPVKQNGFDFTDDSFLQCMQNQNCDSGMANYQKILTDFQVCEKRNSRVVDELWLWGGPWFGYWEAVMAGPNAFNTNGPPIVNTACQKQLHIMGFNHERGVSEMLEDLGHRAEGTLSYVFGEDSRWNGNNNKTPWGKFTLSEKTAPGNSNCGWMHYASNSQSDYDWSNQTVVSSSCENWLNYPNLTGAKQNFNCSRWNCNGYDYKKWWLNHLPRATGQTDGKWNNWWRYILDYEESMPGDVNKDGCVNALDIGMIIENYTFEETPGPIKDPRADINGDKRVNAADISVVIEQYNPLAPGCGQ